MDCFLRASYCAEHHACITSLVCPSMSCLYAHFMDEEGIEVRQLDPGCPPVVRCWDVADYRACWVSVGSQGVCGNSETQTASRPESYHGEAPAHTLTGSEGEASRCVSDLAPISLPGSEAVVCRAPSLGQQG